MGRKAKKSGSGAGMLMLALLLAIVLAQKFGRTGFLVLFLGRVRVAIFDKKKELASFTCSIHSPFGAPSGLSSSPSMLSTNI
jgi:hypothetical protein